jgi:hypothetical protein
VGREEVYDRCVRVGPARAESPGEDRKNRGSGRSGPSVAATAGGEGVTTVGQATSAAAREQEEIKKRFTPAGYNAPPGAPIDAPPGTVFGGKQKFVGHTPMGDQVYWKDVEQPKTTEKEPPKKEEK